MHEKRYERNVRKESFKKVRAPLKLKHNPKNIFQAINILDALSVRYETAIVQLRNDQLKLTDMGTWKLLTMCWGLHPKSSYEMKRVNRCERLCYLRRKM